MHQNSDRDFFVVFVQGKPGQEADYAEWFRGTHRRDMLNLRGVNAAHMFTMHALDGLAEPAQLCAIYETPDVLALLELIGSAKGTEELPESEAQGPMSWRMFNCTEASGQALPIDTRLLLWLVPDDAHAGFVPDVTAFSHDWALAQLSPAQPRRGREYSHLALAADAGPAPAEPLELIAAGGRYLQLNPLVA